MCNRVICPFCGYIMPIRIMPKAESKGLTAKCKNKKCKKEFEIEVKEGMQSR